MASPKVITFGKHRGKSYSEILVETGYCEWLLKQKGASGPLKELADFVRQRTSHQAVSETQPLESYRFYQSQINSDAEKQKSTVKVWVDGSAKGNGRSGARAGCGIFFGSNHALNKAYRLPGDQQTNNRAELHAMMQAIEIANKAYPDKFLQMYSDSTYSQKCITEWIKKWQRNNWLTSTNEPVKNRDIVQPLS
eukprot:Platyproteum_vivax@DN2985_c0_g1_i1.p1